MLRARGATADWFAYARNAALVPVAQEPMTSPYTPCRQLSPGVTPDTTLGARVLQISTDRLTCIID